MLHLHGFSAWVCVDGAAVDEYSIEAKSNGKEITCWIASEAGKTFEVHWRDSVPGRDVATCGRVKVDGIPCGGKIIREGNEKPTEKKVGSVAISDTSRSPLCFAPLCLTDDDAYLLDAMGNSNPKDIGKIKLQIWEVEVGAQSAVRRQDDRIHKLSGEAKIHERTKKAGAHCVRLGHEYSNTTTNIRDTTNLHKHPFVSFIFNYNPLDVLRANGIAPSLNAAAHGSQEPKEKNEGDAEMQDVDIGKIEALAAKVKARNIEEIEAQEANLKALKAKHLEEMEALEAGLNSLKAKNGAHKGSRKMKAEPLNRGGVSKSRKVKAEPSRDGYTVKAPRKVKVEPSGHRTSGDVIDLT